MPTRTFDTVQPSDGSARRSGLRSLRLRRTLEELVQNGPISRTELAGLTGYSAASMTATIRDLQTLGYVQDLGFAPSTGGRRRALVQFDRSSIRITVLAIEGAALSASQIDLDGQIQVQIRRPLAAEHPLESIQEILNVLSEAEVQPSRCLVLSLPGAVTTEGDVTLAPALGSPPHDRLGERINDHTGLPVLIENDVNLISLGEHTAGAAQGTDHSALVYIGEGIGGGLVLDGRIYRGASQSAGELGFLPWNGTWPRATESVGPLEQAWALPGLALKAAELGVETAGRNPVSALCSSRKAEAAAVLRQALDAWAYSAVILSCVLNPERVVFSGAGCALSTRYRNELAKRVTEYSPSPLQVAFAQLGDRALIHGAIARVLANPGFILSGTFAESE